MGEGRRKSTGRGKSCLKKRFKFCDLYHDFMDLKVFGAC